MPTLPGQMFTSTLNPAKGWPSQSALDFQARVSGTVTFDMPAGRCCHLNASGELIPGVVLQHMPLFIFQGVNELDVNFLGNNQWQPVSPSGRIMCLVGKGPYELETTEFDITQTYTPGDILYAQRSLSVLATGGVLTNVTPGPMYDPNAAATMEAVVGIVSRGVFTNAYGVQVISFWPVWLPGTKTT